MKDRKFNRQAYKNATYGHICKEHMSKEFSNFFKRRGYNASIECKVYTSTKWRSGMSQSYTCGDGKMYYVMSKSAKVNVG